MPHDHSSQPCLTTILEYLVSRICHDIISPVGAINNGVEFLQEMGPDAAEEAMELISYSASQAAAKLQAFRIAYGAGGKDTHVKPEDIQKAFSALISGEGKIKQSWDPYGPLGPKERPPGFCKMLMCMLMLGMEALPKGGLISVEAGEENETLIIAEGANASLRENTENAINQSITIDDMDPRIVHPYAVSLLADLYDFKISLKESAENKIIFSLISPITKAEAEDGKESIGKKEE